MSLATSATAGCSTVWVIVLSLQHDVQQLLSSRTPFHFCFSAGCCVSRMARLLPSRPSGKPNDHDHMLL